MERFCWTVDKALPAAGAGEESRGNSFCVCDSAGRVCCTEDKSSVAVRARKVLSTANEKVSKMTFCYIFF